MERIVKEDLNAANCATWSEEVESYLYPLGLTQMLQKPESEVFITKKEKAAWDSRNKHVVLLIQRSVSGEIRSLIANMQTAYEMWNRLEEHFLNMPMELFIYKTMSVHYPDVTRKSGTDFDSVQKLSSDTQLIKKAFNRMKFNVSYEEFLQALPFINLAAKLYPSAYERLIRSHPANFHCVTPYQAVNTAITLGETKEAVPKQQSQNQIQGHSQGHSQSQSQLKRCSFCNKSGHFQAHCMSLKIKTPSEQVERLNKPAINSYSQ